jgi:hypothetical protein
MYLVELRPGREELYRSSDELALAIRKGDVDGRSRIYHRATAKWISITLHPQYKAIVTTSQEEPASRPARKGWTFLGGITQATDPAPETPKSPGLMLHRWQRPLALGISGVLLMLGVQLAFSGPRPHWAGNRHAIAVRAPQPAPSVPQDVASGRQEVVSLASTREWTPAPERTIDSTIDTLTPLPAPAEAAVLPRAPRLRSKSLRASLLLDMPKAAGQNTVQAMLDRYADAYAAAHDRLESGFRVARLSGLFAAPRLGPNGGVTDTRMSLAGAANFVRVYRQQQSAIEAAYQDSLAIYAKQFHWSRAQVRQWTSRQPRTENPALELVSNSLLAGIDSVLDVLDGQAGAYKIRGNAIAFEDARAAQAYGALRVRLKQQIDAAVAAGGATSPGPAGLLLRAIGTSSLPRET